MIDAMPRQPEDERDQTRRSSVAASNWAMMMMMQVCRAARSHKNKGKMMGRVWRWWPVAACVLGRSAGLVMNSRRLRWRSTQANHHRTRRQAFAVSMVFDFVKRGQEQLNEFVERRAREDAETLARFTAGLEKSRDQLLLGLSTGWQADEFETRLEELEETLIGADIGPATTDAILGDVRKVAVTEKAVSAEALKSVLRGRMIEVLESAGPPSLAVPENGPSVILVMGANGMGKTTTIGKLARRLRVEGEKKVLLAACDTFRAAAGDQLRVWADRAEVDLVGAERDDEKPSAVAYRAMSKAKDEDYDVVIVDTSGRLSNNVQLNAELAKIQASLTKQLPGAPHETLLVIDAAVGRNALDQARVWLNQLGVTGLVVTKLDGTSRAGFCVAVVQDLAIPVKLVGVGERIDDLRDFDATAFVDSLLDVDPASAASLQRRFQNLVGSTGVDTPATDNRVAPAFGAPITPVDDALGGSSDDRTVRGGPRRGPKNKSSAAKKKKKKKAGGRRR